VNGISADTTVTVGLATPDGVTPLDGATVDVTITVRPVTGTRSFEVGVRLVGDDADLRYAVAVDRVLITVGGSIADLDRLDGGSLVADLDVSGLGVGTSDVDVTADLPPGVTLVNADPSSVAVTITAAPEALATPSPAATATPTPTASPGG
jgi:YbbR domain-containing protein